MKNSPDNPDPVDPNQDPGEVMEYSVDSPKAYQCLNANGVFKAFGTHLKDLTGVWASVYAGPESNYPDPIPEKPWDDADLVFTEGTISTNPSGPGVIWTIENVPGARGACHKDLFVVWFVWPGADFQSVPQEFTGVDPGQTCSGWTGSCPGSGGGLSSSFIAEPGPQEYELRFRFMSDPSSEMMRGLVTGVAGGGGIRLALDQTHTTFSERVWRAGTAVGPYGEWNLRVTLRDGVLVGRLEICQFRDGMVCSSLVWEAKPWSFFKPNWLRPLSEAEGERPPWAVVKPWRR